MSLLREKLNQIIEPALNGLGYELVLLEYSPGIKTGSLRIFIDTPNGVGMEDCEKVSREVAALLDVEDPIAKAYQLEVSSPGMDRPLTKTEHYLRFVGEKVKIQTLVPIGKRRKFPGTIVTANAHEVTVNVDGQAFHIPLADIERARLVPDYTKEFAKANKKAADEAL